MRRRRSQLLLVATAAILLWQGPLPAARWSHEDTTLYPGTWYRIVFDNEGETISGDGQGQGWYYYPAGDCYRMWYHNGAYDPDRKGRLEYHVYIEAVDPAETVYASVRFLWTTAEWSRAGHTSPPYPEDVPTLDDEFAAMSGTGLVTVDNYRLGPEGLGSREAQTTHTIEEFNPEWVGVEIQGRNAYIFRYARHWCEAQEYTTIGACCNLTTEYCFPTFEENCRAPYTWLGPGTSCDDCRRSAVLAWDFGDAPEPTYPTLLASNGARHKIVPGLYLGRQVDGEPDGQSNATATGDDKNENDEDGVTFTSAVTPGRDATVEVTASAAGYLNAWIDFNADGSFGGPDEQIFTDRNLTAGINPLTFTTPASAASGLLFARFRFNSLGVLDYDGPADDGEVEDYCLSVVQSFEPYPTSGTPALLWNQALAPVSVLEPYAFEPGSEISSLHVYQVVADDWQAPDERPVTGIHWWGTFDGWTESHLPSEMPLAFHIGIWTHQPDAEPFNFETFAHPDRLIWETYATNWTWTLSGYEQVEAGRLGETCFQFTHLLSQNEWFQGVQAVPGDQGTPPVTYWLSITAVYDTSEVEPIHLWAWKTRTVASEAGGTSLQELVSADFEFSWPPAIGSQWQNGKPLRNRLFLPIDMAFQLTTHVSQEQAAPPLSVPKVGSAAGLQNLATLAADWLDLTR